MCLSIVRPKPGSFKGCFQLDLTKKRMPWGEPYLLVWGPDDRERKELKSEWWVGGWGDCDVLWRIISPKPSRLLWHLPGIPQGTSHCCASLIPPSPVKPHISSLFFCVTQAFLLTPPFLLLLSLLLLHCSFSKWAKTEKGPKTCALSGNPSTLYMLFFPFILIAKRLKMHFTQFCTLCCYLTAFSLRQPLS